MAKYSTTILEEELKNKVAADFFAPYDTTQIVGRIDFAVAYKQPEEPQLFTAETQYLLWAEAKRGTRHDIKASLVQLVLTIGQARTYDRHLPPAFLGAFDAEKIAFLPYYKVADVFEQNDFNWNVTPSDHDSKEFRQLYKTIDGILQRDTLTFRFDTDERELRQFIRQNFRHAAADISRIRINKNNFTHVYQKWLASVKPSISIDWDAAKREGLIEADFYLADILSENNQSLKEKLFVLLRSDRYVYNIQRKATGSISFEAVEFNDQQRAHHAFWNHYRRPPRRDYWDYIVERRDKLVPQDVRERKGSYFTPQRWVELSQQYIAAELGEDWQDEYTVWDCCAGTGNLLNGLTNKYNIYASTLDKADVDVMHDRIHNGANLLDSHVFQFDFLNDPFTKLPPSLQDIINDEEKRKRLVIYINPPYAEASDTKTLHGGSAKNAVEQTATNKRYKKELGQGNAELFAQFFIRIHHEIPTCVLAEFSTLKILQGPHFENFRNSFRAKLGRLFCVPANTFDNVKGDFPIGFFIWHTDIDEEFSSVVADFYDRDGSFLQKKTICAYKSEHFMNEWAKLYRGAKGGSDVIGKFPFKGNDFQNQRMITIVQPSMSYNDEAGQFYVNKSNVNIACIYLAVRKVIPATWLNDRDQFLYPNNGWQTDYEFQSDCLVYTLFNNNIQSQYGVNHWIPFTEQEVDAKEKFQSHFMTDYMERGHSCPRQTPAQPDLFAGAATLLSPTNKEEPTNGEGIGRQECRPSQVGEDTGRQECRPSMLFSEEARAVMDAGRELWRYYHAQPQANPDASFYDIRLHFQGTKTTKSGKVQMNPDSTDERYTQLIATLRQRLKALARKIEPKVYEYGFLKG